MIRQLMREQFRVQRAYVVWTTAILTLSIGLAAYSAFVGAQQRTVETYVAAAHGMDGAWNAQVSVATTVQDYGDGTTTLLPSELDSLLTRANDEGARVTALADTTLTVMPHEGTSNDDPSTWLSPTSTSAVAVTGDVDWPTLLQAGDAPTTGEIAVDAGWAASQGVQIGDTVRVGIVVVVDDQFALAEVGTLTVSGLLRGAGDPRFYSWEGRALIDWDSAIALDSQVPVVQGYTSDYWTMLVELSAQTETAALSSLEPHPSWLFAQGGESVPFTPLLASGVVVVGLIGMAFAVGRSQAQARSGWVATARVLGARRSSIVLATLMETVGVGLLAGIAGVGLAFLAIAGEWSLVLSRNPDALLPSEVSVPLWLVALLVGVAVVVSAILGAIPAFWAARVTPSAALKPVTPVTEATMSRRAPVWPLLLVWAGSILVLLVAAHGLPGNPDAGEPLRGSLVVALLLAAAVGATTVMVVVEAMRRLVSAVATRLERSSRPTLLTAGSALSGRPALASAPAAVIALGSFAAATILSAQALWGWLHASQNDAAEFVRLPAAGPFAFATGGYRESLPAIVLAAALLILVALATFLAARHAHRAEHEAHAALGLDGGTARRAAALQFALPLLLGVIVGAVLGAVAACITFTSTEPTFDAMGELTGQVTYGPLWAFQHLSHTAIPVLVAALAMLVFIAIAAGVAALVTRPVDRPAERIAA